MINECQPLQRTFLFFHYFSISYKYDLLATSLQVDFLAYYFFIKSCGLKDFSFNHRVEYDTINPAEEEFPRGG